jgi:hypothetical protein
MELLAEELGGAVQLEAARANLSLVNMQYVKIYRLACSESCCRMAMQLADRSALPADETCASQPGCHSTASIVNDSPMTHAFYRFSTGDEC